MSKTKKIILLIIAVAVILLSFVGGHSYAKYMSRVEGKGTADIANWNFKVNESEQQIQTISLKSTINNKTVSNNQIAPGTEGQFEIKLDATGSEVGIDYFIKFENETQKPTNLKFSYNGKIYNSLTELQQDLPGTINANEQNKIKTIQIGWNWKYETGTTAQEISANDAIDTQNAKQMSNYTFDVLVSGTQVMPEN